MLTGALLLDGLSWNAVPSASASCLLPASCPTACTPPPPACDWVVDWVVELRFPAAAAARAALVWVTEPPPPGLPMRTGVLEFDGLICFAFASASASWSLYANWPTACTPVPWQPQPPPCDCVADWS